MPKPAPQARIDKRMTVPFRRPTRRQWEILTCGAKRICVRGGRRGGKTVLSAIMAGHRFLAGQRVLYAAPTQEQVTKFWYEVNRTFCETIEKGVFNRNKSEHYIERPGTEQRLKAKTAWDPDSLRGDHAGFLILDEFHLMQRDTWDVVGAPMLMDCDGDAMFIFTPPSQRTRAKSRDRDPMHAAKMWRRAAEDTTGYWKAFHFTSYENPYIERQAIDRMAEDMTRLSYRMEILAEDIDEVPGAYWNRQLLDTHRVFTHPPLVRTVVAIDPSASSDGDEAGIVVAGMAADGKIYVVADASIQGAPMTWAGAAVAAYNNHSAHRLIAESNQGGEMVRVTIGTIAGSPNVKLVAANLGKSARAEPVAAMTEQGRIKLVGHFAALESELCTWKPGSIRSPNRLDAFVYAVTDLAQSPTSIPDYSRGGIKHAY